MAANILNSPRATAMSVYIIRAFVKMREDLAANAAILKRLAEIDKTLLLHDSALRDIYPETPAAIGPGAAPTQARNGFPCQRRLRSVSDQQGKKTNPNAQRRMRGSGHPHRHSFSRPFLINTQLSVGCTTCVRVNATVFNGFRFCPALLTYLLTTLY